MASASKAARQRRKDIARRSREASKRRKEMLKESRLSDKAKSKKASKKTQQAGGIRVAIAKAFPTFASALKVKSVDEVANSQSRPKKDFVGRTPSVNLLPSEFTEGRQVANTRRSFGIAGVGIVGALSVVYFAQGAVSDIAEDALFAIQTQGVEAQQKTSEFSDVTSLYDELGERNSILDNIENNSPEYFAALTELYDLLPSGSVIDSVEMTHIGLVAGGQSEDGAAQRIGEACGDPVDPFNQDLRPVSTCISFSGEARSLDNIFLIMESYQSAQLLSNVVVERSGELNNQGKIRFNGTAAVLAEADVSKILGGVGDEFTGDISFGDGNSGGGTEDGNGGNATPEVVFEEGTFTLTTELELVNVASQEIIASGIDVLFPEDTYSYVIVGDKNYELDPEGVETAENTFAELEESEGNGEEGLLDPEDENNPETNGYVVDESGRIVTPFTNEVIVEAGDWRIMENSGQFIITATGEPLPMADIYYQGSGE